jgi:hypothetical protein
MSPFRRAFTVSASHLTGRSTCFLSAPAVAATDSSRLRLVEVVLASGAEKSAGESDGDASLRYTAACRWWSFTYGPWRAAR